MKALEKLFLEMLEKQLEVTPSSFFAGLTSLGYIRNCIPDHFLWDSVHDVLNGFLEFVNRCQVSSMDVHHGWYMTRNKAVYMKPSVACGWAGAVMYWSGAVGGAEYTTDSVMLNWAEVMTSSGPFGAFGPLQGPRCWAGVVVGCCIHDSITYIQLGRSSDAKTACKTPKKQMQDQLTNQST